MNQDVENQLGGGEPLLIGQKKPEPKLLLNLRQQTADAIAKYIHEGTKEITENLEPELWMYEQAFEILGQLDTANKEAIRFAKEKIGQRERFIGETNA